MQDKSTGHITFETVVYDDGRSDMYEYFIHADGHVYRAPAANVCDLRTGYRLGARFFATSPGAMLLKITA